MVNSLESFDEYLLSESNVSERDRALAKQVLIERLKAIYHTRISYPHLNVRQNAGKKTSQESKEQE